MDRRSRFGDDSSRWPAIPVPRRTVGRSSATSWPRATGPCSSRSMPRTKPDCWPRSVAACRWWGRARQDGSVSVLASRVVAQRRAPTEAVTGSQKWVSLLCRFAGNTDGAAREALVRRPGGRFIESDQRLLRGDVVRDDRPRGRDGDGVGGHAAQPVVLRGTRQREPDADGAGLRQRQQHRRPGLRRLHGHRHALQRGHDLLLGWLGVPHARRRLADLEGHLDVGLGRRRGAGARDGARVRTAPLVGPVRADVRLPLGSDELRVCRPAGRHVRLDAGRHDLLSP